MSTGEMDIMIEDGQSVASKIFQRFDTDNSRTLDGNELFRVFNELAKVNGKYLTDSEKQAYVHDCLQRFGVAGQITESQFEKYVQQMPGEFNQLHTWRALFERYSEGGRMSFEHAKKLIIDLHKFSGLSYSSSDNSQSRSNITLGYATCIPRAIDRANARIGGSWSSSRRKRRF